MKWLATFPLQKAAKMNKPPKTMCVIIYIFQKAEVTPNNETSYITI